MEAYTIEGDLVTVTKTDKNLPDEFKLEVSVNDSEFKTVEGKSPHTICFNDRDLNSISLVLATLAEFDAFKDIKISVRRAEVK